MSLEALERSDLSRLPGGIFTRAFIRAYAQEVGLDPDRTIQDFIAELPPETAAATKHPAAVEDGEKLDSDRKAVATALRLVLVSVPIAAFVVYYGMHRAPAARPPAVVSEAFTPAESAAPSPPSLPGAPPAVADASASAHVATSAPGGLTMQIAPKGECWVSVTVDGEQAFSGLMRVGDTRQIAAHDEISLNVGDAGAFDYTLNGKVGRPLGAPGEVVSRRITLADYKDYVTP
jgi:cytoskeletal protein RodZ